MTPSSPAFDPPGFTGSPLDRVEAERIDPSAALAARDGGLLLALDGLMPELDGGALVWRALPPDIPADALLYIGRIDGTARFVALPEAPAAGRDAIAMTQVFALLGQADAATYGVARSLLAWHARHRFCANCGHLTGLHRAGWGRSCAHCGAEHFPRVDPVVIMLAEHGGAAAGDRDARVLVGRQPAWAPGRYSALAGFLEVGESIEEAVARELKEEAGVDTVAVRYVASQPWPFPSQLMIACIARVADDALLLDGAELEDARWIDRAGVEAALAGAADAPFLPPPPYAIAYTLLRAWLAGA